MATALAPIREAGGSLDDFISRVRDAFFTTFRRPESDYYPWVVDVFEDHVITSEQDQGQRRYYTVAMTVTDEAVTFAAREDWQEVKLDYVPAGAAVSEALRLDVLLPVREVQTADDGSIDGVIVTEGRSANGNVYTGAALESGIRIFDGALMFADHPTRTEEAQRPERSVRDVVGRVRAPYLGQTKDGKPALRGRFQISESETALRTKIAEGIIDGLSLRAFGQGKREKDGDFVVESFQANPFTSVDVVTVAAAGGGFEALSESDRSALTRAVLEQVSSEELAEARPDLVEVRQLQEGQVDMKKLEEAQAEAQRLLEENNKLFKELREGQAGRALDAVLAEAKGLPEAAAERVRKDAGALVEAYATHGSEQTEAQLVEALKALVEAERAYTARLMPNGAVTGLTLPAGLSEAPDEAALDQEIDQIVESLRR